MNNRYLWISILALTGLSLLAYGLAWSAWMVMLAFGLTSLGLVIWGAKQRRTMEAGMLQRARKIAQDCSMTAESGNVRSLEELLYKMQDETVRLRQDLQRQQAATRQGELALRDAEERYTIAVSGAEDGLLDWDLRSEKVFYSPRWQIMFGLHAIENEGRIDTWLKRIHPDDLPQVRTALDAHFEGQIPQFLSEHRVQHASGQWVWVSVRGKAVLSATGRAVRLVALTSDISARKRAQEILYCLASGLSSAHGQPFFQNLVLNFAKAFQVSHAFVTKCLDHEVKRVRTLAFWNGEAFIGPLEYDLPGTPCDIVINQKQTCFYPTSLAELFPREAGFESYLGIPLYDTSMRVIGHLALLNKLPMNDPMPHEPIFDLFSTRAGLEMELENFLGTPQ